MPVTQSQKVFLMAIAVFTISAYSQGANVKVNCNSATSTISGAVKALKPDESSTIEVSGHCKENVLIQGFERLTLISNSAATITDVSGGLGTVVDIEDSHVTLQGFTINGGDTAVACGSASVCYLTGNTVQAVVGQEAVRVDGSHAFLANNIIQNNADRGMTIKDGAVVSSSFDIFQGNAGITAGGITLISGGYLVAGSSIVKNNGGVAGILATSHSTVRLVSCTVSDNSEDGINLRGSSEARFESISGPVTVTGNGGSGVNIDDLSFALFQGATVTGNLGGTDVLCNPQFSATRGALTDIGGGKTNCVEPAKGKTP